jgi:hypothetical protein
MGFVDRVVQTGQDAWNGNADVWGDVTAAALETVPHGSEVCDPDWARDHLNSITPGDHHRTEGNTGNHIGTVAGGILGIGTGPAGIALGMSLGSQVGGWLDGSAPDSHHHPAEDFQTRQRHLDEQIARDMPAPRAPDQMSAAEQAHAEEEMRRVNAQIQADCHAAQHPAHRPAAQHHGHRHHHRRHPHRD